MNTPYDQRIDVERRLLAAIFLFPLQVDLEARDFLAPQHGVMFEVLQDAYYRVPWAPARAGTFDDIALAVVLDLVRRRAADSAKWSGKNWTRPAELVNFVEGYFLHTLLVLPVTAHAIPDLVAQVRTCPRCGR